MLVKKKKKRDTKHFILFQVDMSLYKLLSENKSSSLSLKSDILLTIDFVLVGWSYGV